ncbi:MAG: NAD-dependent DNA ligase LigA [Lachnospiraceae bacterium]
MEQTVNELRKKIKYHSDRYYNEDAPEISDFEFDQLMLELKKIEAEHPELITADSPTQMVGGIVKRESGVLVHHNVPMLSLSDVFSKSEVDAFVDEMILKLHDPEFVVEYKIDGLSVTLRYEDGNLILAETRGDGVNFGEDVTANARVISDVKKKLKFPVEYLEIRGEVYMTDANFQVVNEKQELLGKKTFANPRNCAAGTLRQLDTAITKDRHLSMFIFNIQQIRGIEIQTHTQGYELLAKQGIVIIDDYKVCKTKEEVWKAIEDIGEIRGKLPYDIDGAVIKINSFQYRELLGTTSKVPRWAIAYKYPPEEKESTIRDIELSVGRTGRITPTAVFDSIRLCGTNVTRATLHNQDFIDELDIGIGDTVTVYKSGEIIPKIKNVLKDRRPEGWKKFQLPDHCPVCGSPAVREKDTADIKCTGTNCPAQRERHLINFAGRDAMDIKGFGTVYIEELVRKGYLSRISDIYELKNYREELIQHGIVGKEKNTNKLLEAIEKSKQNEPDRLLTGLGIPNVGKAAAKAIMKHYLNFDDLMKADIESLTQVDEIGEISALGIYEFFHDERNKAEMARLQQLGLKMNMQQSEAISSIISSKTFVITGTLPTMDRKAAQELIEKNGGKVSSSVSSKTDFLLAGENAGSKLKKAEDLKIKILSEDELLQMLSAK